MEDYLKELGHLGMIARLKRISDSMLYSIREVYKSKGFDIEPNWHLVFLALKKHKKRTMTELADAFGLSQPALVKIINKMKKKGFLDFVKDPDDNRKTQLQLSKKAKTELPEFENVWKAGQNSIATLLKNDHGFLDKLEDMEKRLAKKNFKERILDQLEKS